MKLNINNVLTLIIINVITNQTFILKMSEHFKISFQNDYHEFNSILAMNWYQNIYTLREKVLKLIIINVSTIHKKNNLISNLIPTLIIFVIIRSGLAIVPMRHISRGPIQNIKNGPPFGAFSIFFCMEYCIGLSIPVRPW
jgi:hypothetical protein